MSSSADFMRSFTRSAWRLEALPQYNPRTDASYRHFVETGEVLPLEDRPGKRDGINHVAADDHRLAVLEHAWARVS